MRLILGPSGLLYPAPTDWLVRAQSVREAFRTVYAMPPPLDVKSMRRRLPSLLRPQVTWEDCVTRTCAAAHAKSSRVPLEEDSLSQFKAALSEAVECAVPQSWFDALRRASVSVEFGYLGIATRRTARESRAARISIKDRELGAHQFRATIYGSESDAWEGVEYLIDELRSAPSYGPIEWDRGDLFTFKHHEMESVVLAVYSDIARPYWIHSIPLSDRGADWRAWVWASGNGTGTGRWFHSVEIVVDRLVVVFGVDAGAAYVEAFVRTTGAPYFRFSTNYWGRRSWIVGTPDVPAEASR